MAPAIVIVLAAALYILLGRFVMRIRSGARDPAFALLNLAAIYYFFFSDKDKHYYWQFLAFAIYLALVSGQYLALRTWGERPGFLPWLAFGLPIAILVLIRYTPFVQLASGISPAARNFFASRPKFSVGLFFVGVSYLAFRTSHLVLEVRNRVVPLPSYSRYLGFAFFAPTLSVGPISPYSQHQRAFDETERPYIPIGPAILRILVGAVKFRFLGPMIHQLTYSELLLDGNPHLWVDLPIASIAYYLYLYCNFSGFCDIAIGGAGLIGIPVTENFQNPFAARNMQDFWNRWHITLSLYMRDVLFSPLSKALVRLFGPANANHAIALTIFVVFLIVGVWHGIGWQFALFGAMHGFGVVCSHYYNVLLKKWLGKKGLVAYNSNRWIHAAAVTLTFLYISASMIFFDNDWPKIQQIFSMLRTH